MIQVNKKPKGFHAVSFVDVMHQFWMVICVKRNQNRNADIQILSQYITYCHPPLPSPVVSCYTFTNRLKSGLTTLFFFFYLNFYLFLIARIISFSYEYGNLLFLRAAMGIFVCRPAICWVEIWRRSIKAWEANLRYIAELLDGSQYKTFDLSLSGCSPEKYVRH